MPPYRRRNCTARAVAGHRPPGRNQHPFPRPPPAGVPGRHPIVSSSVIPACPLGPAGAAGIRAAPARGQIRIPTGCCTLNCQQDLMTKPAAGITMRPSASPFHPGDVALTGNAAPAGKD